MRSDLLGNVRATGLLGAKPVVVLLSGGQDSVCLLDVAVRLVSDVRALHVNYGLRDEADADEALCAATCAQLGVPLSVHRPVQRCGGNLQAWARDERYAAAEALADAADADVAAGHTASDQVESVLYRLAASPGRRALLGMRPRDGRLVRPLLGVSRARTAAHCTARGLSYAEDASNTTGAFARTRVRHDLLPALRALHPAADANVLRTLEILRDEAEVLDAAVDDLLGSDDAIELDVLAAAPPALARLALQRLADRASEDAARAPAVGRRLDAVLAPGRAGGTRSIDLGSGLRARIAYGTLRVTGPELAGADPPAPVALAIPGEADFAGGRLTARCDAGNPVGDGVLDAAALGDGVRVRSRRPGDRMRPLGLGGSRSLQDLFTDRRVPRDRRGIVPVVETDRGIAWIPGVATGDAFRVTGDTAQRVRLTWRPPGPNYP